MVPNKQSDQEQNTIQKNWSRISTKLSLSVAVISIYLQGKRFVKRSLRCMTSGIKAGFSSWGRQCRNIEKNIARVQSDCYLSHNICDIAASNHETLTAVLSPSDVLNERWLDKNFAFGFAWLFGHCCGSFFHDFPWKQYIIDEHM